MSRTSLSDAELRRVFSCIAQMKKRKPNRGLGWSWIIEVTISGEIKGRRGSKAGSMGLIVSRMDWISLEIEKSGRGKEEEGLRV